MRHPAALEVLRGHAHVVHSPRETIDLRRYVWGSAAPRVRRRDSTWARLSEATLQQLRSCSGEVFSAKFGATSGPGKTPMQRAVQLKWTPRIDPPRCASTLLRPPTAPRVALSAISRNVDDVVLALRYARGEIFVVGRGIKCDQSLGSRQGGSLSSITYSARTMRFWNPKTTWHINARERTQFYFSVASPATPKLCLRARAALRSLDISASLSLSLEG